MKNSELQSQIQYTLQLLMIVMIALEVAIPPNPYAKNILIIGFLVIALKYDFVTKYYINNINILINYNIHLVINSIVLCLKLVVEKECCLFVY